VTLELPWPLTANNLHAVVRGRKILSRKGREYRGAARVAVTLTLHPPDRRKRDIANSEKAAIDGLVFAGVLTDDSQIDRLTIARGDVIKGGRLIVQIQEIKGVT